MARSGHTGRPARHQDDVAVARADVVAVAAVVQALGEATTTEDAVGRALQPVRDHFGRAYGSYWRVDPAEQALRVVQESGDAGGAAPDGLERMTSVVRQRRAAGDTPRPATCCGRSPSWRASTRRSRSSAGCSPSGPR